MDDVDALIWPDDLKRALEASPRAQEHFSMFPASAQRFTLRWIKLAKTPQTRSKRIDVTVAAARRGDYVPGVKMPSKKR